MIFAELDPRLFFISIFNLFAVKNAVSVPEKKADNIRKNTIQKISIDEI